VLDHLGVAPPLGAVRQQVTADVAHVPRRVDIGGHRLAAGRDLDLAGRAIRPRGTRGDITVVNVPLNMQRAPGKFRLSVNPNGIIRHSLK
jgi:hypothetical protein